jgi:prepilin-type N-terminal cleavage/methylation domain-containing protein
MAFAFLNIFAAKGNMKNISQTIKTKRVRSGETGFTLIEVACALVIILVALLGVVFSFTYVVNYNAGNNARSRTLAALQQKVEQMRAAKFTPTFRDASLNGGTTTTTIPPIDGSVFNLQVVVENKGDGNSRVAESGLANGHSCSCGP